MKVYPNVYIGDNVKIGNNVILFAGAKVYSETVIGNNCVVNSGAVLGADGFGFAPNENGEFVFKSEPKAPKKAKPAEKSKSNVQTYEDWKAQKKSKPAEKPKDLPRAPKKSTAKADDQSRKRGLAKKKAKSAKE